MRRSAGQCPGASNHPPRYPRTLVRDEASHAADDGNPVSEPVRCPKRMQFGPCGGVRPDGDCEMQPAPCVFAELVTWPGPEVASTAGSVPLVLTDFSTPAFDPAALAETARVLAGSSDAVLVGEHHNRPDFPPTLISQMLLEAGVTPWITLACRDRNRIVLEQELHGLRQVGVDTVLCVTGDGRGYDVRTDVTQVFDLDSTRLAALAASLGIRAAVAESPTAPPVALRPRRLVQKQRAGASIAVLNHCAVRDVREFVRAARSSGLTMPVIAAVAVYTDVTSVAVLQSLPGLELDADSVATVLDADDPVAAGIAAAVTQAGAVLAIDGVAGVNVSGLASERGHRYAAEIKAEIATRIRGAT